VRVSGNGEARLAGHVETPRRKRQFNWDLTPIKCALLMPRRQKLGPVLLMLGA
jgi:hypothetical protein